MNRWSAEDFQSSENTLCDAIMVDTCHHESGVTVLVSRSCLTLCDPMSCSPPGSSVHGIAQARILEWVAIPFSRESS